ncbi:hypothetical protein [Methylorubrum extorquens]|uniref:hypothetical protein n=1 Tax=Methylorubrum extorquens TaxID=408 RepID=UPI0012DB723F|nr:hypothetical protein [Methylorubrum extorquens]
MFVDEVLHDIEPGEIDAVLKMLHARKVVWVSRRNGVVRIYREAPPAGERVVSETTTPIGRFLAAVAPHFVGLADAERARVKARASEDWAGNDAAHEKIRARVHRILGICRSHTGRGLSLESIRTALHWTFAKDALAALVYYEPRLQTGALDDDLSPADSTKPKRSPRGLSVDERVLRLIQKAGEAGITHTRLTGAIRPLLPSSTIREATERLAARGLAETRIVKPSAGRPGERHFATG